MPRSGESRIATICTIEICQVRHDFVSGSRCVWALGKVKSVLGWITSSYAEKSGIHKGIRLKLRKWNVSWSVLV